LQPFAQSVVQRSLAGPGDDMGLPSPSQRTCHAESRARPRFAEVLCCRRTAPSACGRTRRNLRARLFLHGQESRRFTRSGRFPRMANQGAGPGRTQRKVGLRAHQSSKRLSCCQRHHLTQLSCGRRAVSSRGDFVCDLWDPRYAEGSTQSLARGSARAVVVSSRWHALRAVVRHAHHQIATGTSRCARRRATLRQVRHLAAPLRERPRTTGAHASARSWRG